MIQFFQKLKARKGFTLVELIVVIAIIGVLAAILIPVMMGYVTSSRVTSADTTAGKMRDLIKAFLTDADTGGYGMKSSGSCCTSIEITVSGGKWTVEVGDEKMFKSGNSTIAWKNKSSATIASSGIAPNTPKSDAKNDAIVLLAISLANGLQDVQKCAAKGYLVAGNCTLLCYSPDEDGTTHDGVNEVIAEANGTTVDNNTVYMTWKNNNTYAWDGNTAGVSKAGTIVGTSPKLNISAS